MPVSPQLRPVLVLVLTRVDGRFSLVVPESVPVDERGPVPTDMVAAVRGFLGVTEHFGQAEVVAFEAILAHELGLLDASVLFQGFASWPFPTFRRSTPWS